MNLKIREEEFPSCLFLDDYIVTAVNNQHLPKCFKF